MVTSKRSFRIRKVSLAGPLLLLTITYPVSPVLYQAFIYNTAVAYATFICSLLFLAITMQKAPKDAMKNSYLRRLWLLHCALLLAVLATLLVTRNLIAARDFLTLVVFLYLCKYLTAHSFLVMYRSMIYWMAGLVFLALSIMVIFYASEFYYGYPDISWRVSDLYLAPGSPVLLRHEYGDFDYHMPLYLAVIPKNIYSLDFPRLPLIYTEPTYFALFTIPLLFVTLADRGLKLRRLILAVFFFGILVSQSVLGNMLLVCVPVGYYLATTVFKQRFNNSVLIFTFFLLVYSLFSNPEVLLYVISVFNADTASRFLESIASLSSFQLTPFGHFLGEGDEYIRLGAGVIISRYGYVGAFLFLVVVLQFLISAHSLAVKSLGTKFNRICIFSSVAIPTIMAFKVPYVILAMPLLTVFYFTAFQAGSNYVRNISNKNTSF